MLDEKGAHVTTPNSYFPEYNGTFNADDPLVQPWWIPGWTAQNIEAKTELAVNNNLLGPGFPSNLAFVNVTGNFFDPNSSGLSGYLTFMMSSGITVEDNGVYYRLPQRLTGTMNQSYNLAYNNWGNGVIYLVLGRLNMELFATDQTTSGSTITTDNGQAFFYFVTEHWMGGRTYHIQVPSSDAGTSVDIESLIVAGTIRPYQYDPVFPSGNMWTPQDDMYNTVGPYSGV
jgi:hypothetical protein